MNRRLFCFSMLAASLLPLTIIANTIQDKHYPLTHCYHWLRQTTSNLRYLDYKYNYAKNNNGQLTFYTTPGTSQGSIAGAGLYCAKSPAGSISYGDRVIRVDLVRDVVMYVQGENKNVCGHDGNDIGGAAGQPACASRNWDIKHYSGGGVGSTAWYVIRNPQAVASWSANSTQLQNDLLANKVTSGISYDNHADATLAAIKAEIAKKGGETTIINGNARMSFGKLLNDKKLVNQTPPLAIISQLVKFKKKITSYKGESSAIKIRASILKNFDSGDFSSLTSIRDLILADQLDRTLTDTKLTFSDINPVIKKDQKIEAVYKEILRELDLSDLSDYNAPVIMVSMDKYLDSSKISKKAAKVLWSEVFSSAGGLSSLLKTDKSGVISTSIDTTGIFATNFAVSIPSPPSKLLSTITDYNIPELLKIMNLLITTPQGQKIGIQSYMEALFSKFMTKAPEKVISIYDSLSNSALQKEAAIVVLLNTIYKDSKFSNLDPVVTGNLVDRVSAKLDDSTVKNYEGIIKELPIPLSNRLTYMILQDFTDATTKLPTFITAEEYLFKIADRSIAERPTGKSKTNSTNTFRMILSGYYDYFSEHLKADKDNKTKVANLHDFAAKFFYKLAIYLANNGFIESYSYIALQSASSHEGGEKYKNHPMEIFYNDVYGTGDDNFDKFFEDVIKFSYDGSLLYFLIKQIKDSDKLDDNAIELMDIMFTHYISDDMDTFLDSEEFTISHKEKQKWKNFIGKERKDSSLCYVSTVIYKNRDLLERRFKKTKLWPNIKWKDLSKWSTGIYNNKKLSCK